MAMTADQYLSMLQALLPRGAAWTRRPGAVLSRLLAAEADELARIDRRTDDLLSEADPRNATETLSDWERVLGLPDGCAPNATSTRERRAAVLAKFTSVGGQSVPYFTALAASLGYTVTITKFRPHTCEHDCEHAVYDDPWAFAWQVNAALNTIREQSCVDDCEMPLRVWGNTQLECMMRRLAPAESYVLFAYS